MVEANLILARKKIRRLVTGEKGCLRSSFLRVGPKIWNSLPSDMRNLPKSTFRKKTRNKLFEILSKSDDYLEITEIMHQLKFN